MTLGSQAFGQTSESGTYCVSPLRQCASNYRAPEARVCIWTQSCAAGGKRAWCLKTHVREFKMTAGGGALAWRKGIVGLKTQVSVREKGK